MDVRHVADSVLHMANLPLYGQRAVHDRHGHQDALCRARLSLLLVFKNYSTDGGSP